MKNCTAFKHGFKVGQIVQITHACRRNSEHIYIVTGAPSEYAFTATEITWYRPKSFILFWLKLMGIFKNRRSK